jgi:hypothetical protein
LTDDADRTKPRLLECPDCPGSAGVDSVRIIELKRAGATEIFHTRECPQYTIEQILSEDSARRVKQQDAWAAIAFPAARERLEAAAASLASDAAAAPFVAALTQLVQTQVDPGGSFLGLHRWAEILDQHFPPEQPASKPH